MRPADDTGASGNAPVWSGDRVRHELSNLLDGSLRHLSLAIRQLGDATSAASAADASRAMHRLELVRLSLEKMAGMLPGDGPAFAAESSLGQMMDDLTAWFTPIAAQRGITIEMEIHPDVAGLPCAAIEPILRNALRNSLEAIAESSNRHGMIRIVARRDEARLRIEVTDNGPGVDPVLLDERGAFRFGRSTRGEGRGLGLALSADLAANLGGTIALTNVPQGGARLTIDLPLPESVTRRRSA